MMTTQGQMDQMQLEAMAANAARDKQPKRADTMPTKINSKAYGEWRTDGFWWNGDWCAVELKHVSDHTHSRRMSIKLKFLDKNQAHSDVHATTSGRPMFSDLTSEQLDLFPSRALLKIIDWIKGV